MREFFMFDLLRIYYHNHDQCWSFDVCMIETIQSERSLFGIGKAGDTWIFDLFFIRILPKYE